MFDRKSALIRFNLSDCQHGLRNGGSTTTVILEAANASIDSFEKKRKIYQSLSLCDLSKAFECVPFDVLLQNFITIWSDSKFTKNGQTYLSNRQQFVSIICRKSPMLDISLGVPQGSVLRPLFVLMSSVIDDLPWNVNWKVAIYADAITLVTSSGLTGWSASDV